ncbi:GmrSD restriction endonuclease domain-containing protein [Saccharopolyspora taberi]|uniref:HNH endonuclease family protein n=1 Tax=Saccharopolyspora taberi TaxID=60895 RepID=A0ABN3V230_9PSEU
MPKKSLWTTVVAFVLLGAGWLVFESGWLDDEPAAASGPAAEQLAALKVAPAGTMDGYSRDSFEHWTAQPQAGRNCNTREAVLERDGSGVRVNGACEATSGSWTSAYTGETITDPSKLDIDHTVPLANAWRSGAKDWTAQRRSEFANDLRSPQLLAVDAGSNRAKGDQDPSTWKPAAGYWCDYATDWIEVKNAYALTVTPQERTALQDMLGTCR